MGAQRHAIGDQRAIGGLGQPAVKLPVAVELGLLFLRMSAVPRYAKSLDHGTTIGVKRAVPLQDPGRQPPVLRYQLNQLKAVCGGIGNLAPADAVRQNAVIQSLPLFEQVWLEVGKCPQGGEKQQGRQ